MELRELKSFCTVVKLRSVSKAAAQLGVGQPTVTMHIKKLEKEMGTTLFDRVKRPIQPTLAATKLVELVEPLLEGIEQLAENASKAEERGPVRVASTYEIASHTLLGVAKAFMDARPHVQLRIRSGHRSEVLQMVSDGDVDLGIVPGPERGKDIFFQGLFPYERVLVTPLGHTLLKEALTSLDQIARYPLIQMGRGTATRTMLEEAFQRRGLSYEIVVELDSMDLIKRYVALGMGISVGPRLSIEKQDEKELGVINIGTLLPVEQAGIVTLKGKVMSKPVQDFIATMRKTVGVDRIRA